MNLKGYADHRRAQGLRGHTHVAVLNAINDGRLTAPAVRRNGRNWIIDPAAADAQWPDLVETDDRPARPASSNKPASVPRSLPAEPGAKGAPPLAISKQVRAAYDAKLAQLEFQERNSELGRIDEMKREAFALGKAIREGVLSVIPRISADLAAMGDQFEVERRLEGELLTALRSLADG